MKRSVDGFLLVRVGERRVGLELSNVIGVAHLDSVHPVPSLDSSIRGVTVVHGKMVPVLHLGALIEGHACPPRATDIGVLVDIEGRRLCLEVDDVELLVRERGLPVSQGSTLPWAVGVARHADALVPLLNVQALSSRFLEVEPT
jgi:chemotaxis signal transduction protein